VRVLVTGAGGFVGDAAVSALVAAGHTVRALDIVPGADRPGVETLVGDLAQEPVAERGVAGIDAVLHLAVGRWGQGVSPTDSLDGSVRATVLLFRAAAAAGVDRVVLMGSAAVVTGHARGTRIDRATPPAFTGLYPLAKWLQEEVARRHAAGAGGRAMCAPILRPWVVIDAATRRLRTGASIDDETDPVGHDGCFGWVDRHDLADACVRALAAPLQGAPVFHLMANPIGRVLLDTEPAERELGWRPRHDFARDIPAGWRMPAGWPIPLTGALA